jgi:glycosyltransferase involved in cell wall biosynthesis
MMRKIALISEHASPLAELGSVDAGGQNVYVAQIAAELGRRGYRVDVFTRRDDERLAPVVKWRPNVQVVHVPAGPARFVEKEKLLPFMAEFGRYVAQFCRSQSAPYDMAHANFFMSGMVALQLKRRLRIPFAMTFHALGLVRRRHQGASDGFDDRRFEIEARIMAEADAIVAECEQDERDMIELYGALPRKIECVPCGFDPQEFWPVKDARARLGVARDEFVVLQLGRMVARKGVDNVIRAVGVLDRAHGIRASLWVVGGNTSRPDAVSTPELGRLMRIAQTEGVADRVTFTGSRPRSVLRTYYSAADVFVTTPWYEPFGITPLEAMACARPVIGAAVGGLKSTIVDGRTGCLVPANDPHALAERLAALHADPRLARRMGRSGRRRAVSRYTWRSIVDELVRVYERAAAAAAAAPAAISWAGGAGLRSEPVPVGAGAALAAENANA